MPAIALVIPIYVLYSKLGITNNYFGLILLYTVFYIPFAVWLMIGFIRDVPKEIEEAALIDGCSRLQALLRVVIAHHCPWTGRGGALRLHYHLERVPLRGHSDRLRDQDHDGAGGILYLRLPHRHLLWGGVGFRSAGNHPGVCGGVCPAALPGERAGVRGRERLMARERTAARSSLRDRRRDVVSTAKQSDHPPWRLVMALSMLMGIMAIQRWRGRQTL